LIIKNQWWSYITWTGAFIALEFTLNIFGVVVAYWLEFGLGFIGDGRSQIRWRFPIAFQIIPVVIFMVSLLFILLFLLASVMAAFAPLDARISKMAY
jgi:hypothetical protein